MRYPSEILRRADEILADRKMRAGIEQDRRRQEIRSTHPEIQKLRAALYWASAQYSRCVAFLDGHADQALEDVRAKSKALTAAMMEAGYPPTYLEFPAECGECGDKGLFGICIKGIIFMRWNVKTALPTRRARLLLTGS